MSYVCDSGAPTLEWMVLDTSSNRFGEGVIYSNSSHNVGRTVSIGSQFMTELTGNTGSLVSSITFTALLNISDYIVQCGPLSGATVNCPISIAGI